MRGIREPHVRHRRQHGGSVRVARRGELRANRFRLRARLSVRRRGVGGGDVGVRACLRETRVERLRAGTDANGHRRVCVYALYASLFRTGDNWCRFFRLFNKERLAFTFAVRRLEQRERFAVVEKKTPFDVAAGVERRHLDGIALEPARARDAARETRRARVALDAQHRVFFFSVCGFWTFQKLAVRVGGERIAKRVCFGDEKKRRRGEHAHSRPVGEIQQSAPIGARSSCDLRDTAREPSRGFGIVPTRHAVDAPQRVRAARARVCITRGASVDGVGGARDRAVCFFGRDRKRRGRREGDGSIAKRRGRRVPGRRRQDDGVAHAFVPVSAVHPARADVHPPPRHPSTAVRNSSAESGGREVRYPVASVFYFFTFTFDFRVRDFRHLENVGDARHGVLPEPRPDAHLLRGRAQTSRERRRVVKNVAAFFSLFYARRKQKARVDPPERARVV